MHLASTPFIGDSQISGFFYVFYPLSLFLGAVCPYDLCPTDTMMPLGPISLNQLTTHTSHRTLCPCKAVLCNAMSSVFHRRLWSTMLTAGSG